MLSAIRSKQISVPAAARQHSLAKFSAAPRRRAVNLARSRAVAEPEAADEVYEDDEEEQACSILDVRINNDVNPKYTQLTVEVLQYPALLRTIAWTLNGLGVRAQNARMETDEDGYSKQSYFLTDLDNNKLSEAKADNVKESLYDFIQTCMPKKGKEQEEWGFENVSVSNLTHGTYTELIIKGEPAKAGFLLEIATVMSAIGCTVHEAIIQGDRDFAPCCPAVEDHDFEKQGRIFRFLLSDGNGAKLNGGRVATVLYTLDLVTGRGHQPMSLKGVYHLKGVYP